MSNFSAMVGPAYQSQSRYAAAERCVNWYPESIEDPHETKTRSVLYPTPCTGLYGVHYQDYDNSPPTFKQYQQKSRAMLELNGRLFGINGTVFFEFAPPTTSRPQGFLFEWGRVLDDGNPATMIANGVVNPGNQQIFITSGDKGYIFQTGTNVFTALTQAGNSFIGGRGTAFLDDFFISIIPNTNGIQVSNQNDGLNWSTILGQAVAYTQGQSDVLSALIANQEYLYLFGTRRSEIWNNNGGTLFPFSIQPGAFAEMGIGGQFALCQADNSIFFLGQDARGGRSIWRMNGLIPERVSNHAVEYTMSRYSSVADCIMYSFTWVGHIFIRCIFPSAGAGWTYDAAESRMMGFSVWHENTMTDTNGNQQAPLERCHAYYQGVHVVGSGGADGNPGQYYQFTNKTIIDADPHIMASYSNDGGNDGTFLPERKIPVGRAGEYATRILMDLAGSGRDRVFKISAVDYGDAAGALPILRTRVAPHIFHENKTVFYNRLELEMQKGIGSQLSGSPAEIEQFWTIVNAYLTFEQGVN